MNSRDNEGDMGGYKGGLGNPCKKVPLTILYAIQLPCYHRSLSAIMKEHKEEVDGNQIRKIVSDLLNA